MLDWAGNLLDSRDLSYRPICSAERVECHPGTRPHRRRYYRYCRPPLRTSCEWHPRANGALVRIAPSRLTALQRPPVDTAANCARKGTMNMSGQGYSAGESFVFHEASRSHHGRIFGPPTYAAWSHGGQYRIGTRRCDALGPTRYRARLREAE